VPLEPTKSGRDVKAKMMKTTLLTGKRHKHVEPKGDSRDSSSTRKELLLNSRKKMSLLISPKCTKEEPKEKLKEPTKSELLPLVRPTFS